MLIGATLALGATPDLRNPALNPVTWETPRGTTELSLIAGGKPCVTLVVPREASDPTWNAMGAAQQIAEGFRLVTGHAPAIVREPQTVAGPRILIGDTEEARAAGLSCDDLPAYGFRFATLNNAAAIVGHEVGYGVTDFQERILNLRWYYPGPDGTDSPPIRELSLPPCAYSDFPRQGKRMMWPWQAKGVVPDDQRMTFGELGDHPTFMAMVRHLRAGYAGPTVGCHTFPNFNMYAKDYPECFELGTSGQRTSGDMAMPCYSHPKTLELHVQSLEKFYADGDVTPWLLPPQYKTAFGLPLKDLISFSPIDLPLGCQCELCKANLDPNGGEWGRYSKIAATFAANLAREIQKRWPDKVLTYLPYMNYTEPPQGVTFPDNVHVMVCLMNGVGMSKEPTINEKYARWIRGWRKLTGHPVQLWEYICWPDNHALPIVSLHTIKAFKQQHANDSIGSFLNGPSAGPQDVPGGTWACGHININALFRLLWNPDYDVDAMLNEYVVRMYGPASKPMGELIHLLQDRWEQTRWSPLPEDKYNGDLKLIHEQTMPREQAQRLRELLAQARQFAGDTGLTRRRVDFFGRTVDVFLRESDFYHEGSRQSPPTLKAVHTDDAPVCDGKLDELCWQQAPETPTQSLQRAYISWTTEPEQATIIRAAWCARGIALAMTASEPCMDLLKRFYTTRDVRLTHDDSAEFFLMPPSQIEAQYQLIANTQAAWWDMLRTRNPDGSWFNDRCALDGVQVGAALGDAGWTLEVFIPFASLVPNHSPKPGDVWKANFIRNRNATSEGTIHRWSTRYQPANNVPAAMGVLVFQP
ncbi:MAG: DUF4838 domain-containing protein [Phycisphaeraceae bacterium]|nr:DUF4838 domain-containing protein [Phycisphaeraceae bacterium]